MKKTAFREYLTTTYDKDMGTAHAIAIVSRCRRVENELGVDLDKVADAGALGDDLDQDLFSKAVRADLRSALNRYQEFKMSPLS
jgi:hypothetical protein